MSTNETTGAKRGPKNKERTTEKTTLALYGEQWEWLGLWNDGNRSEQVRDLLERAMKFWPDGPDRNGAARGSVARPGGKRDLQKKIKMLEAQLLKAGLTPVTKQNAPAE